MNNLSIEAFSIVSNEPNLTKISKWNASITIVQRVFMAILWNLISIRKLKFSNDITFILECIMERTIELVHYAVGEGLQQITQRRGLLQLAYLYCICFGFFRSIFQFLSIKFRSSKISSRNSCSFNLQPENS